MEELKKAFRRCAGSDCENGIWGDRKKKECSARPLWSSSHLMTMEMKLLVLKAGPVLPPPTPELQELETVLGCSRPTPVLLHIIRGDAQVNARRQCEGCDDDDYDCSHYTPDKTVTLSPTHTIVLEDGKLWRRCQMIIQKN